MGKISPGGYISKTGGKMSHLALDAMNMQSCMMLMLIIVVLLSKFSAGRRTCLHTSNAPAIGQMKLLLAVGGSCHIAM